MLAALPLATNPLFQHEIAVADTGLRASLESLLHATAEELWAAAVDGRPSSLEDLARTRAAATWATERATDVVDTVHRLGGGGRPSTPTHRCSAGLRDIHTLTKHFIVRPDTLTTAGAVLAGQEPDVPVF